MGNALLGASALAFALDVLPPRARGLGIGLFRCAGDLGAGCATVSIRPFPRCGSSVFCSNEAPRGGSWDLAFPAAPAIGQSPACIHIPSLSATLSPSATGLMMRVACLHIPFHH